MLVNILERIWMHIKITVWWWINEIVKIDPIKHLVSVTYFQTEYNTGHNFVTLSLHLLNMVALYIVLIKNNPNYDQFIVNVGLLH